MTEVIKVDGEYWDEGKIRTTMRTLSHLEEKLNNLQRQYQYEDTEVRKMKDRSDRFGRLADAIMDCIGDDLDEKFECRRDR